MPIFPERAPEVVGELAVVDAGVINHEKTSANPVFLLIEARLAICTKNYKNFSSITQTSTWIIKSIKAWIPVYAGIVDPCVVWGYY